MPDVRNVRSGRQHGTVRTNHDVQVQIEDVEDRLNEILELVRRYDEANGTDPVPDQVKKACIISNTPEPLKTHLQLNVAKLGNFNALRVATSAKGKAKKNPARARRVARKEKKATQAYGETITEHSRFEGECRICGKYGHKASGCRYRPNLKAKARTQGSRNPK